MPRRTTKPERDEKHQHGVYGEPLGPLDELNFENIHKAAKYFNCTKEEIKEAIQRNAVAPDPDLKLYRPGSPTSDKYIFKGYYLSYKTYN